MVNLKQIAELYERDRSVITKHISNIYKNNELTESATCAFFTQVQIEGERILEREVIFYKHDVILSIGYRVKS